MSLQEDLKKLCQEQKDYNDYFAIKNFVTFSEVPKDLKIIEPDGEMSFPYYCRQTTGYLGDDFSGTLWVELEPDFFAVIDYSC